MSATEVNARLDLMQRLLGPVMGRLQNDFLDPMVERTFRILWRNGLLPTAPEGVAENEFDIEYTGPMARAQRTDRIQSIEGYLNSIGAMGEMLPEMVALIDQEGTGRLLASLRGAPVEVLKTEAVYKKEHDDRMAEEKELRRIQAQQMAGEAAEAQGKGETALKAV